MTIEDEERRRLKVVNSNALKGLIVTKGLTQKQVAKKLKMTPKTFSLKLKKGVFGSDEIEKMIDLLDISDPVAIFFVQDVT
ncbi:MAG: DUF739 family protein [Veillonella sp.]|uniref:DUF739 family protein n=1 Tax=Veillonella sp. TaxID=1926307 RepID=UPI002906F2FF|nr:DUF739 family protein [Veillonella sp.]MDU5870108.1 DUF739 family protein [Veillonella sp.]